MAKTDKSYRIRTEINKDTVLNVPLQRDIDFLEILSLKIPQQGMYQLHTSDYGVIVGRVLANNGFGVPNVRLSVFVPLTDEDYFNNDIAQYYPYSTISTPGHANKRYNLLPDSKTDDCYRIVGTFPNKRLVLDNDNQIEIFDKYWKYTTVTNASGDYMLFGVPCGVQTIHMDVDLSNIGILSQKPRDFVPKGYNINSFDNASQFKESNNLDNLVQIIGQNQPVNVYPFWGDKDASGDVAITRADINIAYKFETSCVFMGSVITDDQNQSIGHNCNPAKKIGYNRLLHPSEGTIEMIRKTQDGLIEEFQIEGNRLIDSDGVWCYQIPMNLDYVVTDEFGNLVPTDNPNKGIATRTSVRFRVSIEKTGSEGFSRHRAEYLVPNNPLPSNFANKSNSGKPMMSSTSKLDINYEFGSATPDECFRDLYWNKVYSVKNYIPRIQTSASVKTDRYTGLRTTNYNESLSPVPFNNARFKFPFSYQIVCILMEVFFVMVAMINALLSVFRIICIGLCGFKIPLINIELCFCPFDFISCIHLEIEDDESADGSTKIYAPGCWGRPPKGWIIGDMDGFDNRMQRGLAQENEVVNFDFYNDWLNGVLYLPLWFWKKTKKKRYLFGLIQKEAKNLYCGTNQSKKLYLAQGCPIKVTEPDGFKSAIHNKLSLIRLPNGVVYEKTNKDGFKLYYYAPAAITTSNQHSDAPFVRLFATDIILLGSLMDCDLDSIPKLFEQLPNTTSNVPSMVSSLESDTDSPSDENAVIAITGLDWMDEGKPPRKLARGLLFDLGCVSAKTYTKTIVNTRRLCELGVTLDSTRYIATPVGSNITYTEKEPDGLITRYELEDIESRAMFATLNHNGLDKLTYNPITKYSTYKLEYIYPIDFDGALAQAAPSYTSNKTFDEENEAYLKFRFGSNGETRWKYAEDFPMYNNSFYFYFGINQGKTALEKFYSKFYATCFENNQEPFMLSIEDATPGEWCTQEASATIKVDRAKTPYSLNIIDSMGLSFIMLIELKYEIVNIKYWDDEVDELLKTSGGLTEEEIDNIKKTQGFYSVTNLAKKEYNVYSVDFVNGMYKVSVTDVYGRTIVAELNLMQQPLSLTVNSVNLSTQYQQGQLVDEESSGKIIINSLSIDGNTYYFPKGDSNVVKYVEDGVYNIYGYRITENGDIIEPKSNTVQVKITPSGDNIDVINFSDALIKYELSDFSSINGGMLGQFEGQQSIVFKIGVADSFNIDATMYCSDNTLSDNIYSTTVGVDSSDPLVLMLDGVDVSILNKVSGDGNIIWQASTIGNPNNFTFPPCTPDNQEWWSNYVAGLEPFDSFTSINNGTADAEVITRQKQNNAKIIQYKLSSILSFVNASWNVKTQGFMQFSSTGGARPQIYTAYPNYGDIVPSTTLLKSYDFSDSTTTIQINGNYPIIVNSKNYYTSTADPTKTSQGANFSMNSMFAKGSSNYSGVIDLNNPKISKPDNISAFKKIGKQTQMEGINDNDLTNYFSLPTVDKRIDYRLYLFKSIDDEGKNKMTIVCGEINRVPSSQIFGGIALSYDDNYNIISADKDLEYFYDLNNATLSLNTDSSIKRKRKYYNVSFATDESTAPLNESSDIMGEHLVESTGSTYAFPVFKFTDELEYVGQREFAISVTPCSLNTQVGLVNQEDSSVVDCVIDEGDTVDMQINMQRSFTAPYPSIASVAENDYWNVYYKKKTGTKKHEEMWDEKNGGPTTLEKVYPIDDCGYAFKVSVGFAVKEDTVTDDLVYTSAPKLLSVKKNNESAQSVISQYEDTKEYASTVIKEDYTDSYMVKNGFVYSKDNPSVKLSDDGDVRSAIYYNMEGGESKFKDNKSYRFVVKREYIKSDFNITRLARKALVYESSDILDGDSLKWGTEVKIPPLRKKWNWWQYALTYNYINLVPMRMCTGGDDGGENCYGKKYYGYVIIYLPGVSVLPSESEDAPGTPEVAVKIGDKVYGNAYLLPSQDDNGVPYSAGRCLIPLYTLNDPDTKDDDKDADDKDNDENDTDDVFDKWEEAFNDRDVTFVYTDYTKNKNVYFYAKRASNGLIYKFHIKNADYNYDKNKANVFQDGADKDLKRL